MAQEIVPNVGPYPNRASNDEDWSVNVGHVCDRGRWHTQPHAHPTYAQLNFVRRGSGVMNLEGSCVPFKGPCALVLPPDCVHGLDYEVDVDRWVVTIDANYLRTVNEKLAAFDNMWTAPHILQFASESEVASDVHKLIQRLDRETRSRPAGHLAGTEALLVQLMLLMVRATLDFEVGNSQPPSAAARIAERFRRLVDEHYRKGLRTHDYASMMAISSAQLRAACVAANGQTPPEILRARVVTEAKRILIFGEMSVEQIAVALGFRDTPYLTRFFQRQVGQTPGKFREVARAAITHESRA